MFKKYLFFFLVTVFIFLVRSYPSFAGLPLVEKGFYTGYGISEDLKDSQGNYKMVILAGRLGWDLNSLFDNNIPGELIVTVEPFINPVIDPGDNVEMGTHFMLKYGYRFGAVMPYIEAGTGLMYTTQHVKEQGTQFNFSDQGGAGLYWFFEDNTAINFGYRFRHFSNLGIKDPNGGVDIHSGFIGISWFFK